MESPRILLVDDDALQLQLVKRFLAADGFVVETTTEAIGASNRVRRFDPHLVLLDVNLPALQGDKLLELLRRHSGPKTRFVLYSSMDESSLRALSNKVGADGWLSKSTELEAVSRAARRFCEG